MGYPHRSPGDFLSADMRIVHFKEVLKMVRGKSCQMETIIGPLFIYNLVLEATLIC